MEWNVYRYNINGHRVEKFNIFNHCSFAKDFEELKQERLDEEQFVKKLDGILMYYFWCKYEHEVVVGEYSDSSDRVESRIDIYDQIKLNWNTFVDYVLGRTSPYQIGDKLWHVYKYGDKDPCEVTVCMMTQKADRSWKIRVRFGASSWEMHENTIGQRLFHEREEAEEVTRLLRIQKP